MAWGHLVRSFGQRINQVLTIIFLALYVITSSNLEIHHWVAHEDELVVVHFEAQEKDPCHQQIVHHNTEEGCDHDTHLTVSEDCQVCDLAYRCDQVPLSTQIIPKAAFSYQYYTPYKISLHQLQANTLSLRAPPSLS